MATVASFGGSAQHFGDDTPRDRCLVCSASARPWARRHGRDLVRCQRCGFAWIPQGVMRTASGTTIYDDDAPIFLAPEQADYYKDASTVDSARAKLKWVSGLVRPGGTLLDVGANFGHFVRLASERFAAVGIEPSRTVVAWGREHLGANLDVGSIDHENPVLHHRFDAVTLFDVIEHLPDPRSALERCRRYLNPAGRLFLTTPDAGSLMARALGRHWYYVDLVEHVSLFRADNLISLLGQTGFRVLDRRTFGRRYRFSYIERRLRQLSRGSAPLRVAHLLAVPLRLRPDAYVALNFGDIVGLAVEPQ